MANPLRLAGPVFEFELLTTSRRGRYYMLRAGYALVLLLVLWQAYEWWVGTFGLEMTPRQASNFALFVLGVVTAVQMLLVLALTPALVAGVIAAEKQSKTLHYVLASPMNSLEIVLGKLLARMLHVGIFLGLGLPILSMLVLMGGVDPRLVLLSCATGVAAAWFLAALGVLMSTLARGVREAIFVAYALETLWLLCPTLLLARVIPPHWVWVSAAVGWVNDWLEASSPFGVGLQALRQMIWGGALALDEVFWMIGIQATAGLVFVALAVWRLRPVFRRQCDALPAVASDSSRRRAFWQRRPRRECGDTPVWWKESHTGRSTRLIRLVGVLVVVGLVGPILYELIKLAPPAFVEAWENSGVFGPPWTSTRNRLYFMFYLQLVVPLLCVVGILQVAGAAAVSITSEHEGDSWISLTATDLSGREVVFGKMLAAIWGARRIGLLAAFLVVLGVASDSVDWLGAVASALSAVVFAWFATALGVWVSLHLKSSWRAQFLTVSGLLLINLLGQTTLNLLRYPAPLVFPGFMPAQVGRVLFRPGFLQVFSDARAWRSLLSINAIDNGEFWTTVLAVVSLVIYSGLATGLCWHALRLFEKAAGRPQRPKHPVPRPDHDEPGIEPSEALPAISGAGVSV
jgi:ABC-type transport system involved in multi-copper enzyme maturation permease subunit